MEQKDITIFYPFWTGKKYVVMPYSFLGTITSFSNAKDSFDFIQKSYLTEAECKNMCDALNNLVELGIANSSDLA